ncbi:hypothetical protein PMAYCL1PPCAC_15992, partial [Pristionchus mayeri]
MGLKQRCDESVLSFRSRIEKTARFAFPFNPEHRVTPTLEVFISGLKDTIRWKIYDDEEPRNLSKAMVDLEKKRTKEHGTVNELELILGRGAGLFVDATPQYVRANLMGQFVCDKLHGIGEGRVYKGLEGYKREIEIILEGGFFLSKDNATADEASLKKGEEPRLCWTAYLTKKGKADEEPDDTDEICSRGEEIDGRTTDRGLFTCNECGATFLKYGNLLRHLDIGRHRIRPEKVNLYDLALQLFKKNLEDVQAHNNILAEVSEAVIDMTTGENHDSDEGWA